MSELEPEWVQALAQQAMLELVSPPESVLDSMVLAVLDKPQSPPPKPISKVELVHQSKLPLKSTRDQNNTRVPLLLRRSTRRQ